MGSTPIRFSRYLTAKEVSFWLNGFGGCFLQNSPRKLEARWWQLKYFFVSPRTLGKMSNLTVAYFSDGLVQPQLGSQKISHASSSRRFGCNKVLHRCQIHQAQRWRLILWSEKKSPTQVSNEKKTWLFRMNVGDDSSYPVMCGILTISSGSLYKTTRIGIPWDENHRGMHHLSQIQVASPQNRHRPKRARGPKWEKSGNPFATTFLGALAKLDDFCESWHGKWLLFQIFHPVLNGWMVNFLLPRYFLGKREAIFSIRNIRSKKNWTMMETLEPTASRKSSSRYIGILHFASSLGNTLYSFLTCITTWYQKHPRFMKIG